MSSNTKYKIIISNLVFFIRLPEADAKVQKLYKSLFNKRMYNNYWGYTFKPIQESQFQ